jgi:hypothetical protein
MAGIFANNAPVSAAHARGAILSAPVKRTKNTTKS